MRILVVEDEKKIARFIAKALEHAGFAVDTCHDGNAAYDLIVTEPYAAVIMDVMLAGRDGLSILRQLREERRDVPVILATARGRVPERIEGLNLGADDYLPKPFETAELLARLHAVLRRRGDMRFSVLKVGDLSADLLTREVLRGGQKVELPPREFALLTFLMRTPGRVYTQTQLCEHVWDYHFDPGTNVVEVYIGRLRRKVDDDHEVKLIHTIRGVGYTLRPPA